MRIYYERSGKLMGENERKGAVNRLGHHLEQVRDRATLGEIIVSY